MMFDPAKVNTKNVRANLEEVAGDITLPEGQHLGQLAAAIGLAVRNQNNDQQLGMH